jgi:hypothetical protein
MKPDVKDPWERLEYNQADLTEKYCSFVDSLPITDYEKSMLAKLYDYRGEWYRRYIKLNY